MKRISITISVPVWFLHLAWAAGVATAAAVVLVKSGATIYLSIGGK